MKQERLPGHLGSGAASSRSDEHVAEVYRGAVDTSTPHHRSETVPLGNNEPPIPHPCLPSITRADRRARTFPLTFGQKRFWFLDRLDPGNPAYNFHLSLQILGDIDREALRRALSEILRRHESLRTCFEIGTDGDPVQRITLPEPLPLPEESLQHIPEVEREQRAIELASEHAVTPFDLTRTPLVRTKLLYLGPRSHVLLVTIHQIVCDEWSLGVLVNELHQLYPAFRDSKPSPLVELDVQYVDFASWQRDTSAGETMARHLAFWKNELRGTLPVLELPSDRPRLANQTLKGSARIRLLSRELRDDLVRTGLSENATLFMTVLAGFKILLYRYTGERDVIVGSPVANRTRPGTDSLIGLFANILILRTALEDDPSFRDILSRVRRVTLDAYSHQELPFEKLVDELGRGRNLGQNGPFHVIFGFQNTVLSKRAGENFALAVLSVKSRTAQFDLSLSLDDTLRGLVATAEYKTDLFDAATIDRVLAHFENLLQEIVKHPDRRLSQFSIITPAERRTILEEWNHTQAVSPVSSFVHRMFEARARITPESPAVMFLNATLTYGELDRRSNCLARWLRAWGVGVETVVAVCMDPSLDMVVALFAVLKAGGAYLPLDPCLPPERVDFMLKDCRAALVLTQEATVSTVPQGIDRLVLDSASLWTRLLATESDEPLADDGLAEESLAYVVYTSGSTGWPKGVGVSHRSLAQLLTAVGLEPGLTPSDVLLSVTTISFDIAAIEIFLPLITGARLALVPRMVARDGKALLAAIRERHATVMQGTPANWRLLTQAGWTRETRGFRVLCGGDELTVDLALALLERSDSAWNLYGPTETTIWSTVKRLDPHEAVTIGRPIARTRVYVLDRDLIPVPVGVPGELYIAGRGVARGYVGRSDLTAERFLPDPFSASLGERMYRTGDVGRFRASGEIEYLGRNDRQAKVRGFRIELGEIENALRRAKGVQEAVVLVRRDSDSETQLTAFLVCDEKQLTVTELRGELS